MQTIDAGAQAQLASPVYGFLKLVELSFSSGTVRVTNYPVDITVLGQTWTGVGGLARVGEIKESEDGRAQRLDLALSQIPSANLALALGNVSTYQGRRARVYVGVMDSTYAIVGAPALRFVGFMDRVRIERKDRAGEIILECQSGAYNVRSNPAGLRMNNAQHQARYPGERGFEYVEALIGKPQVWLSTRFQQQ